MSADLEVAEIHRRVIAADGPALLFTGVEGAAAELSQRDLFWHQPHFWGVSGPGIWPFSAVRSGDWKLHVATNASSTSAVRVGVTG